MIKQILVYLYGENPAPGAIRAAASFAAEHDADLTGLFVTPDIMNYSMVYGAYPLNLAQSFFDIQKQYQLNAKKVFNEVTAPYKCITQWHELSENDAQVTPAFYSDILFVSQPTSESSVIFNDTDFIDKLIMETGLPTVVVPSDWNEAALGERPLLGWKETREAVRTVRHTLALMRAATIVDVVTAVRDQDTDRDLINGVEISAYLTSHEVQCKFYTAQVGSKDKNETQTLLRHANEYGCDLIIIGGYGHSRFREIVLGGVTRGMLRSSPVPVLVSH